MPLACWSPVLRSGRDRNHRDALIFLRSHCPIQSQTHLKKPRTPRRYWIVTTTTSSLAASMDPSKMEARPLDSPPPWIHTITCGNQFRCQDVATQLKLHVGCLLLYLMLWLSVLRHTEITPQYILTWTTDRALVPSGYLLVSLLL